MADDFYDPYANVAVAPPPAPAQLAPAPVPAQLGPAAAPAQPASATPNLDATMAQLRAAQPAAPAPTQTGTIPVIDVGTPTPNAQPGQMGSQFRPVQVGAEQKAGTAAMPAAVAPPAQPAAAAAPTFKPSGQTGVQMLGGSAGGPAPTTAAPAAADPYANVPPAPAQAAAADPYATVPGASAAAAPAPQAPAGPAPPDLSIAAAAKALADKHPWAQPLADAAANIQGGAQSLVHGGTFGLDEILAPLPLALYHSAVNGVPFSQAYDQATQLIRGHRTDFEQAHPYVGTGLEIAGGIASPANKVIAPLFGAAKVGATLGERALTMGRNIAAGAGVGAGAGAGMTDGDIRQRLEGAAQGAVLGGALQPVAGALVGAGGAALRAIRPQAQIPGIVGRTITENFGGAAPTPRQAPVPSVPLTLPEATGSAKAAAALDTINAMDVAAQKEQQAAQNKAAMDALMGRTRTEPRLHYAPAAGGSEIPDVIAARGSTMGTRGVQSAAKIIDSEEHRLWNKPSLTKPNVSSFTAKNAVAAAVRKLMRDEPGLELAIDESAVLRRTIEQLNRMPQKTAANQLNAIYSRFRRIARDPKADGDVKLVASRLADAVQDGIANAPEIVGQAPATQAELERAQSVIDAHDAAARQQLAAQPLGKPPPRPQTLTDYLHSLGGISRADASDIAGLEHGVVRNVGGKPVVMPLVRTKGGIHWDKALEAVTQGGNKFLPTGADKSDLIDALRNESHGMPVYRQEDEAAAQYWREADDAANRQAQLHQNALDSVNETANQMGQKLTPVQAEHAVQLLANDTRMHPEQAIMDAVRSDEERLLQDNANRLAFSPPGDLGGATYQVPLPDMQVLREGIKPDPQLVRDLDAARKFTRREAETLGHAAFDNILRRNSRGNEPVVPGTAMGKFFDFANGVERPGDVMNVSKFLGDIKSEWSKLSLEERAGSFDPREIDHARMELEQGTRNYLFGKMMDAITNTEADANGLRRLQWKQAVDWLDTNRDMLANSGLFTRGQLDLLDRFRDTAQMIYAGTQLGKASGSPTFTRAMHPVRFIDAFIGPVAGRFSSAAAGALMGNFLTRWFGEAAIGAMIGAEMGGAGTGESLLQAIYRQPREKLMQSIAEAYRNPDIARDMAQIATNPKGRPSPATVQWLRTLLSAQPPAQAARYQPHRQPEMAQ